MNDPFTLNRPKIMQLTNTALSALLALSLASCASLEPSEIEVEAGVFHRSTELEKVEFNDTANALGEARDERRHRTGVHVRVGTAPVAGFFEVFAEDFLDTTGGGLSLGIEGRPKIHTFENGVELFVPYSLGGTFVNLPDAQALGIENDAAYIEFNLEAGIGARWGNWEPSVGLANRGLVGVLEFPGEDEDDFDDEDLEAELNNTYLEIAYRAASRGLDLALRAMGGEESGIQFSASWGF